MAPCAKKEAYQIAMGDYGPKIYDGHTLALVIDATEELTGCAIERAYVDNGYRGHHTANPHRVFISEG
jgi:hypothetical protein